MSNNKIAKNTLLLYFRMILTMIVTIYTSRVVLNVLGVEDYGVYGIVGGVVALFGFLNSAMSAATQRYLAFDIGKDDFVRLRNTFNATLIIHVVIAFLIIMIGETLGMWFLKNKLIIPADRIDSAKFVFHLSLISAGIAITQVPFNALIIARERMNVFAVFSIVEVVLKLIIVYLLFIVDTDKLKLYSILLLIVTILVSSFYKIFCFINFKESKFKWLYDKEYFIELISYSGWNLFGSISAVAKGQGINIILNLFFGIVVNAAYAIMIQVQSAVNIFVANFLTALRPQIIKNYASNNLNDYYNLIIKGSKYAFYLLFIIVVPIIYNIDFILKFWLKTPPKFTNIFIILSLLNLLIESLSGTLMTGVQATGEIKWYQIILGGFLFLNLPVSYFIFLNYKIPYLTFTVAILLSCFSLFFRLVFLKKIIQFNIRLYFEEVIIPVLILSISSGIIFYFGHEFIKTSNIVDLFLKSTYAIVFNIFLIFLVGMTKEEKIFIMNKLKLNRKNRKNDSKD